MTTIFSIETTEDIHYWKVTLISATEMEFDIKIQDSDKTFREICRVALFLARLDFHLSEAYDDAFRTKPRDLDVLEVKKFIERNSFINVNCAVFSDLGFHGATIN